jgi:hypothetical protein
MSSTQRQGLPVFKTITMILGALCLLLAIFLGKNLVEENQAGYYQIKQSFPKGIMSERNAPGYYGQWLDKLTTYKISEEIALSSDDLDGGDGAEAQAVRVQFPDGYADIDIVVQYILSTESTNQQELHRLYGSNVAVKSMIRQQIIEAFQNTGSLFNSGDAYADRRSDFISTAKDQVVDGLYMPMVTVETITNKDNTTRTKKHYTVKLDNNGFPIIKKESTIASFGITFTQFNVKDMKFDPKLMALIDAKKDAQKAEQDAITAKAAGDAKIATERATQEIEKIKQVTIAQKNKEVAVLDANRKYEVEVRLAEKAFETERLAALKALETAKKIEAEGMAKANANRALVAAGLTPLERANIDKDTAIGVAREIAKVNLPGMMIIGGDGQGGTPVDPFTAVGVKAIWDLSKEMSDSGTSSARVNNK